MNNIMVERLWRSVKYEKIFLRDHEADPALVAGLKPYFKFYNLERTHQNHDWRTPAEVHFEQSELLLAT